MKIRFTYNDGRLEETRDVQYVEWASGKYDGVKIELPVDGGAVELERRKQPEGTLTADGEKIHSLLVMKSNPDRIIAYEAGDTATWVSGAPEMSAPAAETKAAATEAAPAAKPEAAAAKEAPTALVDADFEDYVEGKNRANVKFRKAVSDIDPAVDLDPLKKYSLLRGGEVIKVSWVTYENGSKDKEGNTVIGRIQDRKSIGTGADRKYTVYHHAVVDADGKVQWKSGAPEMAQQQEQVAEQKAPEKKAKPEQRKKKEPLTGDDVNPFTQSWMLPEVFGSVLLNGFTQSAKVRESEKGSKVILKDGPEADWKGMNKVANTGRDLTYGVIDAAAHSTVPLVLGSILLGGAGLLLGPLTVVGAALATAGGVAGAAGGLGALAKMTRIGSEIHTSVKESGSLTLGGVAHAVSNNLSVVDKRLADAAVAGTAALAGGAALIFAPGVTMGLAGGVAVAGAVLAAGYAAERFLAPVIDNLTTAAKNYATGSLGGLSSAAGAYNAKYSGSARGS